LVGFNPELHLQVYLVYPTHWVDAQFTCDYGIVQLEEAQAMSVCISLDLVAAVPADEGRSWIVLELDDVATHPPLRVALDANLEDNLRISVGELNGEILIELVIGWRPVGIASNRGDGVDAIRAEGEDCAVGVVREFAQLGGDSIASVVLECIA
jgi:hypothetical protein